MAKKAKKTPPPISLKQKSENEAYLTRQAKHMAEKRSKERDITIPPVVDPKRRMKCKNSLKMFMLTYLKDTFRKKFSNDHHEISADLRRCIMDGDDIAIAADRGKGKSSIARAAMLWAILYGHIRCGVLLAGTVAFSKQHMGNIKAYLQKNKILAEDFPEVCIPIIKLGNSSRRADTQTVNGELTYIEWGAELIRMPEVEGSACSGSVIICASIEGSVRGHNIENIRPDLVLLDDIETRKSVKSYDRTEEHMKTIREDVEGLKEQGNKFSKIFIGSIMAVDSIADILTDPTRSPSWNGKRYGFLTKPPNKENMWMSYIELRQDIYGAGIEVANKYYADNFDKMNDGAIVSWAESYDRKKEKNALQHYYNEWADNGIGFIACEYQNDPMMAISKDSDILTANEVIEKTNAYPHQEVPEDCTEVTAFFDVHGSEKHIYYTVCGFAPDATTYVLDYGTWPENKNSSIGEIYKDGANEIVVRKALKDITDKVLSRTYTTASGADMFVSKALIDSGWQTATVYDFCRKSKEFRYILAPSKGEYMRGDFMDKQRKPGEKRGEYWLYRKVAGRPVKIVQYDTVYWKKQIHGRVKAPFGYPSNISLWGNQGNLHRKFADHICSEYKEIVNHKEYGDIEKWLVRPGHENHWFDCLIGCCVAASMQGITIPGMEPVKKRKAGKKWGPQLKRRSA